MPPSSPSFPWSSLVEHTAPSSILLPGQHVMKYWQFYAHPYWGEQTSCGTICSPQCRWAMHYRLMHAVTAFVYSCFVSFKFVLGLKIDVILRTVELWAASTVASSCDNSSKTDKCQFCMCRFNPVVLVSLTPISSCLPLHLQRLHTALFVFPWWCSGSISRSSSTRRFRFRRG